MNNCKNCKTLTNYFIEDIPICFKCICEIERKVTETAIIKRAELATGISYAQMKLKTRKRDVVDAKHYAMKLLREADVGNLVYIGGLFNNGHSNVVAGIKKINELIETKQVRYDIEKIGKQAKDCKGYSKALSFA
jgi:chromosomal replication initiation ATPase DnaA